MKILFNDLHAQTDELKRPLERAIASVVRRGDFILGSSVESFERQFAEYIGTRHAIGVASGTDALFLSLKAAGIGPGDRVLVPTFTFIATANAVSYTGATPVFTDVDERTFMMTARTIRRALTAAQCPRRIKAVIPVHLFGQSAPMPEIMHIAHAHRLIVIEDAAQAHGLFCPAGSGKPRRAGAVGTAGCFSFYPTKNLGGMGDGGMVTTDSERLARALRTLRNCGRSGHYHHPVIGYNSRLDTLQAAVLSVKLGRIDRWNKKRKAAAARYTRLLNGLAGISTPLVAPGTDHIYHAYSVLFANERLRDAARHALKENGIPTMIYYPLPLHLQPAYRPLGYARGDLPVAEDLSRRILALPLHPFLTGQQSATIARTIRHALTRR